MPVAVTISSEKEEAVRANLAIQATGESVEVEAPAKKRKRKRWWIF